jgi:hypothetical protein
MRLSSIVVLSALAFSSTPAPAQEPFSIRCATTEPDSAQRAATDAAARRRLERRGGDTATLGGATIEVHVHVINKGSGLENGDVPDADIRRQIDVLQATFASAGFEFRLAGITRTTNERWYRMSPGSVEEAEAKTTLHRGTAETLNFYVCGMTGGSLLGWATFPSSYEPFPTNDGVVIHLGSLPGGSASAYNEGKTAVHQIGHWLGLSHTFHGACSAEGDFIADTPAERWPAYGCPVGRDTCRSPGADPVENFMNLTDDSCVNHFTPDQIAHMQTRWSLYRAGR